MSDTSGDLGPNTIDLDRLRLIQNFADLVGVKKELLVVSVRKPDRQWFIRVRPEPEWSFTTATLTVKEERGSETYIVDRALWEFLPGELVPTLLVVGISRQNAVFVWPLRLPGADGHTDTWSRSALGAAELAKTKWVRVAANMATGMYDVFSASADLPSPSGRMSAFNGSSSWPSKTVLSGRRTTPWSESYAARSDAPVQDHLVRGLRVSERSRRAPRADLSRCPRVAVGSAANDLGGRAPPACGTTVRCRPRFIVRCLLQLR